MKKFPILLLLAGVASATPVEFPLKSFFYGANYTRGIQITAVNGTLTDGTNLFAGSYINVLPTGGTNPVVELAPNNYTLSLADVRTPVRFAVSAGTNRVNVLTLITGGLASYYPFPGGGGTATNINNASGTNVNLAGFTFNSGDINCRNGPISISDDLTIFQSDSMGNWSFEGTLNGDGSGLTNLPAYVLTNNATGTGGAVSFAPFGLAAGNNSFADNASLAQGDSSVALGGGQATGFNALAYGTGAVAAHDASVVISAYIGTAPTDTAAQQFVVKARNGSRFLGSPIYGDGSGLTSLQATNLVGGLTTNLQFTFSTQRTNTLYFTNGILMRVSQP